MTTVHATTIGFTQTSAEHFFTRLKHGHVRRLIDVRLHNTSQLAGFAKSEDLAYFLREILGIEYVHQPLLAPTDEMLKAYKKEGVDWATYQRRFVALMAEREIERKLSAEELDGSCLLCSEALPHKCHRRLVLEYLRQKWGTRLEFKHL